MARRTKEDAAKTRRKILKAALDLFSTKGYDKTTFENIAARIGLTKGAVYWHFGSKPELLRQLIIYLVDEATGEQRIVRSQPSTFEELRSGLKEWIARILEKPMNRKHVKMLFFMDWSRPGLADVRTQFKHLDNSIMNVTTGALRRMQERGEVRTDVDIETFAYMIGLAWVGIMHCQLGIEEKDYKPADIIDCLMDSIGKRILVRECANV